MRVKTQVEHAFEPWLLSTLTYRCPPSKSGGAEASIWGAFLDLTDHLPLGNEDVERIRQALFNPKHLRIVGLMPPVAVAAPLRAIGFTDEDLRIFPGLSYRMLRLFERVNIGPDPGVEELVALASSFPPTTIELEGVRIARARSSQLARAVQAAGGELSKEDLGQLSGITEDAVSRRDGARDVARRLGRELRKRGVHLDSERFARTEMATIFAIAHWRTHRTNWTPDTLIYRPSSAHPCRECLRLYKRPNGMPLLYRVADVDVPGAFQPNRGPRRRWKPKLGPCHGNCVCAPWQRWHAALERILAPGAEAVAEQMRRLKLA